MPSGNRGKQKKGDHVKPAKIVLPGLAALALSTTALASYSDYATNDDPYGYGDPEGEYTYDYWDKNYIVQALLGAVQYENLKFDVEGTSKQIDLSLIPQIGAGWGTVPKGNRRFQYGLECSFLLGFMSDDIDFYTGAGNSLHVRISTDMWMFDLAGGPYANVYIDKKHRFRLYIAAGPLLTYADYSTDCDEACAPEYDDDDSAFGIGVYARTGLEFRIFGAGMLGVGVRGSWANVDFSDVGGNSDLTGLAAFVSFTAGM